MAEKTLSTVHLAEAIRKAAEPRTSNRFARTASGHDRRAEGMRRGQEYRAPAHRPRRVPGRG
ncbi:hypothetical protein [Planomonospora algeriensis]